MRLTDTDLALYCQRIGFTGKPEANLATLRQLHALHPLAIAFENLDAWRAAPVLLEPDNIVDKLVRQRRGGYCFEHNLLFMAVLQALGFKVTGLAARVLWNLPPDVVLPQTHMLLLVELNGVRYIADTGFGGLTMTAPLQLDTASEQDSSHERLRIRAANTAWILQAEVAGNWQALYRFTLEPRTHADYTMANWFVSTHPQSRFVTQLIGGRADHRGRHALLGTRYSRHYPDQPSVQVQLESPQAVRRVLEEELLIDTSGISGLDARLARLFTESWR